MRERPRHARNRSRRPGRRVRRARRQRLPRADRDRVVHAGGAVDRARRLALAATRRRRRCPGRRRPAIPADVTRIECVNTVMGVPLPELESGSGDTFAVTNPATGETLAELPRLGAAETARAIERAGAALPGWRALLAKDRARILRRWADLMREREDGLARLMVLEQGKPIAEARAEVEYAASFYEWFGEEAKRVYGDTIPTYAADRRVVVTKDPVGVTAGITPWNFPAAMPTRKSAPALAAGCTMVLKPPGPRPHSTLAIARLGLEAGLPEGVFEIVTCSAEDAPTIGAELTGNPIVRKLGFTGSTEVGKLLMAQCAKQVEKVSLERGRHAPLIVFDDAHLEASVARALVCDDPNT